MDLNRPKGGSEILRGNLEKWVDPDLLHRTNIIMSSADPALLSSVKPNIMWQHLNTDEAAASGLRDPGYRSRVDQFVFVSHWQMEKFIHEFGVERSKSTVIRNAVETLEFQPRNSGGKIRLIYTSTPWRGLHILLDAFRMIDRGDVELVVYSSTAIYGVEFMKNKFDWLFDRCRATPGVKYIGYGTNKAVRHALGQAHILAYPSVFQETSCLAAIEAGCAGCRVVTTDYGALPETLGQHARYVPYNGDQGRLVAEYAGALANEVDQYWKNYSGAQEQSKYFNAQYSWNTRAVEWNNLLGKLCGK